MATHMIRANHFFRADAVPKAKITGGDFSAVTRYDEDMGWGVPARMDPN